MKLNSSIATSARSRSVQLALLGSFAVAALVACSEDSGPPAAPPIGSAGTFSSAGTTAAAGTSSTAGSGGTAAGGTSTGTAGTFSSTAGTGGTFGTAGTDSGGTSAGGTGGAGGTDATAGTGGTPEPPKPYCDTATLEALPYVVNTGFQLSGWSPSTAGQLTANGDITTPPTNACMGARVANAVGDCSMWRYTKNETPSPFWVQWITMWDSKYTHPPVCIATGAKAVTFSAKGVLGGEKIQVSAGGGMQKKEITLTTEWKTYFVPLDGVDYNSFSSGVVEGFAWEMSPTTDTPTTEFFLDNIQWVATAPTE